MKWKHTTAAAATALTLACGAVQAEEDELAIEVSRLTMDAAVTIAQKAIAACRKEGVSVAVAVVDRNGIVQAHLRDTVAPPITLRISRQKAYTAANFQANSGELDNLATGPIGRVPGVIMSAGGVPIEAGGKVYGAVGVSGAPSGEMDAACANDGIGAIRDDLEMAN